MTFYLKGLAKKYFAEKQIVEYLIKSTLKDVTKLNVVDISGGCGQSFNIEISSKDFKGKTLIQQHRLINDILKKEFNDIHALTLKTSVPIEKI
jgi:stress-induced morphogen